jgi:UDP-GlcNAc:undecaprenyl-phosphate GlcNAc-1-phosphate transferase
MYISFLRLLLFPLIAAAALSFFLAPLIIKFAWKAKLIDDPKKNTHPKVIHTIPTPRGGGLGIYFAILIACLLFLPIDRQLIAILLGGALLVVMGIIDDKKNLNPYLRLVIQFIAASIPIAAGIGIAFLTNPFNGIIDVSNPQIHFYLFSQARSIWVLSDVLALFWIVALINFLNMGAKGVPGQLPGIATIAGITIAILSFRFSADIIEWPVTLLAAIVAGSFLGFLPWNTFPQRIMPAFSGSNVAGYFLAILAILTTAKVGTLTVVLAVPLIDTGYTIVRRILSGKSPVWGDRGHLHHKLLDLGISQKQVAFLYWGVTAILGFAALYLNATSKFYTIIGVSAFVGGLLVWLTYRKKI